MSNFDNADGLNFKKLQDMLKNSPLSQLSKAMQDVAGVYSNLPKISPQYITVPKLRKLRFPNTKLQEELIEEREKINELLAEVSLHQEKCAYLYNRLSKNPQSSALLSISIIVSLFLIITCISIPLLLVPTDTYISINNLKDLILENIYTIKGVFVLISTILTCLIFIIFLIKNISMKFSKNSLLKLEEMSKMENYSEYLKNYVENTKE